MEEVMTHIAQLVKSQGGNKVEWIVCGNRSEEMQTYGFDMFRFSRSLPGKMAVGKEQRTLYIYHHIPSSPPAVAVVAANSVTDTAMVDSPSTASAPAQDVVVPPLQDWSLKISCGPGRTRILLHVALFSEPHITFTPISEMFHSLCSGFFWKRPFQWYFAQVFGWNCICGLCMRSLWREEKACREEKCRLAMIRVQEKSKEWFPLMALIMNCLFPLGDAMSTEVPKPEYHLILSWLCCLLLLLQ